MQNKFAKLLKDTAIFAIGNLGSKIILFFLVPLYTNCLTTDEYGIAEYVFTISQLLVPIVSVSIWEGTVRMGLKKGHNQDDVIFNSLIVFLVSVAIIIVSTPLWNYYDPIKPWKYYLSLYSILYILNQICLNFIKIKDKNKLFAIISVIQTLVLAGLNILLLVVLRLGIRGYLISNILALLCADCILLIAGEVIVDAKRGKIDHILLKSMMQYSAPLVVNNISWWVIHSSDKLMIEQMLSDHELGLYTVASKIPSLINVFVSVFTQAWSLSSIREMESTNDTAYYKKVFEIYSFFLFACMIVLTAIIKPFMAVYVGKDFVSAWQYVPLLFYAAVFQAFSSYFGGLFGALQKSKKTMTTTLIGGLLNIVLNYAFIKMVGVWGALIGTVSAFVVITFLRYFAIENELNIGISMRKFLINAGLCLALALMVSLDYKPILSIIIGGILFVFINRKVACSLYGTVIKIIHLKKHR